ncbi:uncharacterized protein isoform X1 [Musca autumnalis]|uniref:uncharacterized protein isoform X1 n=1 Tax=Musca autumnalis TaxID=221902 RepID=UPI003CE9F639
MDIRVRTHALPFVDSQAFWVKMCKHIKANTESVFGFSKRLTAWLADSDWLNSKKLAYKAFGKNIWHLIETSCFRLTVINSKPTPTTTNSPQEVQILNSYTTIEF